MVKELPVVFDSGSQLTLTKTNSDNRVVLVAQNHPGANDENQRYTAKVTDDENVGEWALFISGLEERYYDEEGHLWICSYKITEDPEGQIPATYMKDITYDGFIDRDNRNITMHNVRMEGGNLKVIKQIATGSDNETEDPFRITVKLTPPLKEGSDTERENVFEVTSPSEIAGYIGVDEEETILVGTPEITVGDDKVVTITMNLAGRGSFTIKDMNVGTTYEVSEDLSGTTGWKQVGSVSYSNSNKSITKLNTDTATITNEQSTGPSPGIKIVKIDETTRNDTPQKKLSGAKFKLYKYTESSDGTAGTYTVYPDAAGCEKEVSSTEGEDFGTLTYETLFDGEYKIEETQAPEGYVKTEHNDIFFKVENGVLTRYDKAVGEAGRNVIAEGTNVVNITYSKEQNPTDAGIYATFTVGNEPGAELPKTGGIGTTIFYVLGSLLVITGGIFLIARRRMVR